jgi:hypothetical protein
MTATYYRITTAEFEGELSDAGFDWDHVTVPGTKERVYDIATDRKGIVVRVLSTLTDEGAARDTGRDAIRVMAYSRAADRPLDTATRTHRIDSWASNLVPKIQDMVARVNAGEFDDEAPDVVLTGLDPVADDEDAVVVDDLVDTRYGRKAVLASPYDAKDAIKALDWDATHRAWDEDRGAWTVDADALGRVRDDLAAAGWPLRVPSDDTPEGVALVQDAAETVTVGDRITVTYAKKNGNGLASKSGEVVRVSAGAPAITFRRGDRVPMRVSVEDDGTARLTSPRSHYPYVGEPTAVDC